MLVSTIRNTAKLSNLSMLNKLFRFFYVIEKLSSTQPHSLLVSRQYKYKRNGVCVFFMQENVLTSTKLIELI
jgi:hypothetical protein